MSWVPLSRLLSEGRHATHVVAWRAGATIPFGRFRADVAALVRQVGDCRRAALACDDSYNFAVGLLALLSAGAEVLLPANTQPDTLAELDVPLVDDAAIGRTANGATGTLSAIDPERCQIIFHTSGSTAAPKRVPKTLHQLEREAKTLQAKWGSRLGGPVLATVSHQHQFGLAFRLLWPLSAGVPFDAATSAVWEDLLPKLAPGAAIVSSPAHLGRLAGLNPIAQAPNLIFSAGAPLSAAAAWECRSILGCLPIEIFGSTETGAVATRQQDGGGEDWRLLPGNAIELDADCRMSVRSPYVDGAVQTEDLAERLGDAFRFLGRADRIVKVEGKRVSLPAVEAALEALPHVAAAAVVALPGLPLRLGGLLTLTKEGEARLRELGAFRFGRLLRGLLARRLEPAGLPRVWRFTDALPSRAMGKRDAGAIMALFAGNGT